MNKPIHSLAKLLTIIIILGTALWLLSCSEAGYITGPTVSSDWSATSGYDGSDEFGLSAVEAFSENNLLIVGAEQYLDMIPLPHERSLVVWFYGLGNSARFDYATTLGTKSRALGVMGTEDHSTLVCGELALALDSNSFSNSVAYLSKFVNGGNHRWTKSYGGAVDYQANLVTSADNGGYLLAGSSSSSTLGGDFLFFETDDLGELVLEERIDISFFDVCKDAIKSSDGSLLMAGYTHNEGETWNQCVLKVSNAGTKQWEYVVETIVSEHITSIIELSDGSYAVCGLGGGDCPFTFVSVLSPAGELIWATRLDIAGHTFSPALCESHNGGLVVAGNVRPDPYIDEELPFVTILGEDGINLTTLYLDEYSDCQVNDIVAMSDGSYWLVGAKLVAAQHSYAPPFSWDVWVSKIGITQ